MRTLQRFATVCFLGAAFAALFSACSSSDPATPGGAGSGAAGAPAAGASSSAGAPAAGSGAAGAGTAGAGTAGGGSGPTGNATNGEALYKSTTLVCNSCHGDHGEGKQGPNITGSSVGIGAWTEAQFHDALRLGKNRKGEDLYLLMPKFDAATLPDAGIADLYAYLKAQMSATAVTGMYCDGAPCTGSH